ncbi:tetratricopeptide repeat protein [Pseudolabrys sp. FHR47]|uniref:tetratricopeptide repeat protein n=1 Tax=Pseudolabrys sp. FHR47 TaxID=2562284 RepID=UPI0010BEA328|nr:tetratricopeptide repeat protein [Pseudolabrys sp. FHR47]
MDRFRAPAILVAAALALAGAVASPSYAEPGSWVEPPANVPKRKPFSEDLNFLFGALKVAPDETSAKAIEQRIWAQWMVSTSDTANLLMTRVRTAIEAKDTDLAIKLLDGIVKIRPDYVEGWNRRATLYYMKKEYGRSLADIREVLRREPRHFGALAGLGLILQDIGDDKRALDAYRRALDVYPRLQRIPDVVKKLQEEVEGRDI